MRIRVVVASGLATLMLLAGGAGAENRAVGIVQSDYQGLTNTAAPNANRMFQRFRDAGYATASGINLGRNDMTRALAMLQQPDPAPGRRIVVLTGRFMKGVQDTYLMQPATDAPGLARAAEQGVALSQVVDLMQDGGTMAVLLLGDGSGQLRTGPRLQNGIGPLGVTGPVTVLAGTPAAVEDAAQVLLRPGATPADALRVDSSMRQLAGPPLRPAVATPRPPVTVPAPAPSAPLATVPQVREAQLNLSRDERREVQRLLTALGHNTRGVDGIFGSGTRAAISRWQRSSSLPETGYLDARTLQMLRDAGAQAEARAKQLERARDQAYWEDVAQPGGLAGMQSYLERYPKGIHAAEARRAIDRGGEAAAYRRALDTNTIAGWRAYLDRHGNSGNAPEARRRLAALETAQKHASAEAALGLPAAARQMIESRLKQMGHDPGRVDGTFDANTRRAIRAYQRQSNLPATGYLDQNLMVRMLAESIFGG